jgi:hypothetical protein
MDDQPTGATTETAPIKAVSEKWRPSFGDIVTVLALVAAIIMWFAPPNWEIGIPVIIVSIALVAITALRHTSHPFVRGTAAVMVVALLVAVVSQPIWESFHKDYPNVAFRLPISFGGSEQRNQTLSGPPDMPPINLPGPPLSKFGKVLYFCQFPPKVTGIDRESAKAAIRRNLEIFGNETGLTMVLSDIAYGIRYDVTAKDLEGALRMNGLNRVTIQIEVASNGLFVTLGAMMTGPLALLQEMGIERGSDTDKAYQKTVETIVGVSEGKCRLL